MGKKSKKFKVKIKGKPYNCSFVIAVPEKDQTPGMPRKWASGTSRKFEGIVIYGTSRDEVARELRKRAQKKIVYGEEIKQLSAKPIEQDVANQMIGAPALFDMAALVAAGGNEDGGAFAEVDKE